MSQQAGTERTIAPQVPTAIANAGLFFRRWLANPLQMGSIVPSSPSLCRLLVKHAATPDGLVLELGAGTGVISRALLDAGLPARRLVVVEIVPDMADHLRAVLPGARVEQGDARELPTLLQDLDTRIGAVICGVPLVLLRTFKPLVHETHHPNPLLQRSRDIGHHLGRAAPASARI